MTEESGKDKGKAGGIGTHGLAPVGYIEVAGSREALQKAAEEITKLRKEVELLREQFERGDIGRGEEAWDYTHLSEDEKLVLQTFLKGDFKKSSPEEVCRNLDEENDRKAGHFKKIYDTLKNYGTVELLRRTRRDA